MEGKYPDIIKMLDIYKNKDELIDNIYYNIENINILKAGIYDVKSVCCDGLPRASQKLDISDKIINDKYNKQIKKFEVELEEIEKICNICEKILKGLEPKEFDVINLYYIKSYKWAKIANKTSYSIRQIRRIRDGALKKMNTAYKLYF